MNVESTGSITVGDFFEDCGLHPCLCTDVDEDGIYGVSLFDGSGPRSCSLEHCAPKKLTLRKAITLRKALRENNLPILYGRVTWAFTNYFSTRVVPKKLNAVYIAQHVSYESGLPSDWGLMYEGPMRRGEASKLIAKILTKSPTLAKEVKGSKQYCIDLFNFVPYIFPVGEMCQDSPMHMVWRNENSEGKSV